MVVMRYEPFTTMTLLNKPVKDLRNIVSIMNDTDVDAEHITRLTWFLTREKEYYLP